MSNDQAEKPEDAAAAAVEEQRAARRAGAAARQAGRRTPSLPLSLVGAAWLDGDGARAELLHLHGVLLIPGSGLRTTE